MSENVFVEIERKFLPKNDDWKRAPHPFYRGNTIIWQGYLNTDPNRTVRIRIVEHTGAYITVKGLSTEDGLSRFEWEKEIPVNEAKELMKLCEESIIKKRHIITFKGHTFEVDEYCNASLKGLVLIEVELKSIEEEVELPDWVGEEVTGDPYYYNSNLGKL